MSDLSRMVRGMKNLDFTTEGIEKVRVYARALSTEVEGLEMELNRLDQDRKTAWENAGISDRARTKAEKERDEMRGLCLSEKGADMIEQVVCLKGEVARRDKILESIADLVQRAMPERLEPSLPKEPRMMEPPPFPWWIPLAFAAGWLLSMMVKG